MKTFKLENLPLWAREKIHSIEWADDLIDDCIGIVNLKDAFEFLDGGHTMPFYNKSDLLDLLKNEVERSR